MATLPASLLDVDRAANRQPEILRSTIPFVALTLVAVFLRFWSRRLKRTIIAADDYMIVAGLVSSQVVHSCCSLECPISTLMGQIVFQLV